MTRLKTNEKSELLSMARSRSLKADFERMAHAGNGSRRTFRRYTADEFIAFTTVANRFANHARKKRQSVAEDGFVL